MPKYTAILEQGDDGNWSAFTVGMADLIIGAGKTKEAAKKDLQTAITFWRNDLKETGRTVPVSNIEVVTIEVPS
jgi:predicted RNase H-like HicB family nuclease